METPSESEQCSPQSVPLSPEPNFSNSLEDRLHDIVKFHSFRMALRRNKYGPHAEDFRGSTPEEQREAYNEKLVDAKQELQRASPESEFVSPSQAVASN